MDPKHYKVELESNQVWVLRISYGPHKKSAMHEHPAGVAVFLTDNRLTFTLPDGKTAERNWKAGETRRVHTEKHLPENLSDKRQGLI